MARFGVVNERVTLPPCPAVAAETGTAKAPFVRLIVPIGTYEAPGATATPLTSTVVVEVVLELANQGSGPAD
ncbi:MAG: hypothetical protein F8N36_15955 [Desulfovibrio sp.]|uniref:hypothetical protein n=1 Tax=Desulfovibrio sp. TaxID=885 RepID=UPI00135DC7D4|nr:hypothetical protein [Desulfovibrio sp.]MTJ94333.1 hypothetical protein [Desulfovibrio sp.]